MTVLNNENDKLLKQLEITDRTYSLNKENEKDLSSKMKKKDDECNALWDTLKDVSTPQAKRDRCTARRARCLTCDM